jgi:hydroxymethylbilane synthase
MQKTLRIGTRGSKLALWQAEFTRTELTKMGIESELVIIKTQGDLIQHLSFDKMEGKGFFTKEIEDALLRGEVDLAVHSMKDMPTTQPDGLVLTAVSDREDPADWLILRKESVEKGQDFDLKKGAIVGTSSARRKAQMQFFRPDVELRDLRGNVPTRLEKLARGDYDAIFLAAAGVRRLDLQLVDFQVVKLSPREFIPAPAQGVLAWQTNISDRETRLILQKLHRPEVSVVTNVERKVLNLMDGGCQLPLGVFCHRDTANNFHVQAACQIGEKWRQVRLSSSTQFGLAERVVAALQGS